MKRLSTEKRNQLILVIIGTVGLISAVYFLLISPQKDENQKIANKIISEQDRLDRMKSTIKMSGSTAGSAGDYSSLLARAEEDIASGDLFAWTYDTIRRFKSNYQIDIPSIGQPALSEVEIIPNFPYKQIKFSLVGTGYYHDIGKFAADFENKFPHMRINNLVIDPTGGTESTTEKLGFRLDIVALVKSNT